MQLGTVQFLKESKRQGADLAQDRVDISEAIKCLARAMSKPKAGHMTQLKRVARYLKGVPRKALQYTAQEPSRAHLKVHVDKTSLDSAVQKVSTWHVQREDVQDWVCKDCLPTGT